MILTHVLAKDVFLDPFNITWELNLCLVNEDNVYIMPSQLDVHGLCLLSTTYNR